MGKVTRHFLSWLIFSVLIGIILLHFTKAKASSPCHIVNVDQYSQKECPEDMVMTGGVKISPPTIKCGQVQCE